MRSRGLGTIWQHGISPNKLFDYCLFASRSVIRCEGKALMVFEGLATSRHESDGSAALADALMLRPGST
jgi:hypothetical protein